MTPNPGPSVASVERDIGPATVDPRVTRDLEAHVAINPATSASPKKRLFVMLPGTSGPPHGCRLILRAGTARGYHAIGLS